ncbi:unnamed protein product [Gongylonema pulchrum]|uniref:Peptidase_S9_N domain-containing protein n=1 Tax=Gongylonema pulchrum TaxID=637853 RepID=A0A183E2C1_9BILA|nr:unnamed protein product [Gongylonema pulchrum]
MAVRKRPKLATEEEHCDICIDSSRYPIARKDENIVDNFHGIEVRDPYRWLEDSDSKETKSYVHKLNAVSESFIASAGK